MDDMIALNITALTHLIYAAAPAFVARGTGTIINIASIVGIAPETLNGVYGASKAYVIALSHSLRHELADKGVRVQVVLPGAIATDFWNIAGTPVEHLLTMARLHAANRYDRLTHDVEAITGRPATSARDFVARHAGFFGPNSLSTQAPGAR